MRALNIPYCSSFIAAAVFHSSSCSSFSIPSSSPSSLSSSTIQTQLDDYATEYHAPVMATECINAMLDCHRGKERRSSDGDAGDSSPLLFIDATLGGGGHSAALLEKMEHGDILIGVDQDPDAIAVSSKRLSQYLSSDSSSSPLFVPLQCNFRDLKREVPRLLADLGVVSTGAKQQQEEDGFSFDDFKVDGILMDLGVSSHQINEAERGFAFMQDGPLDMRMTGNNQDGGGLSAADICNEFDAMELSRIFKQYGDEPRSKRIANAIIDHRPLVTTSDLADAVSTVTPDFHKKSKRMGRTSTLARIFQSLRIVVNDEDRALKEALMEMAPALIRPGGRLVVLSYHSMEDRAVKRVMRDGDVNINRHTRVKKDLYGNVIGAKPKPWKMLGKGRKATEEEVEVNSRARSARLRVGERLESE